MFNLRFLHSTFIHALKIKNSSVDVASLVCIFYNVYRLAVLSEDSTELPALEAEQSRMGHDTARHIVVTLV